MAGKEKVKIVYNQGCPDWMLTFGDCMSLLLCFFVMLMTFSTPDENKLMDVIGGLQGALGAVEPAIRDAKSYSMTRPRDSESQEGSVSNGDQIKSRIDPEEMSPINLREIKVRNRIATFTETLYRLGFKNVVTVQQLDEGVQMEIPMERVFSPGSDEFKPGASKWMEPFAGLLESIGNEARLTAVVPHGGSVVLAKKRLDVLSYALSARYKIKADRISAGIELSESTGDELLKAQLSSNLSSRELPISEFFRSGAF